MTTDAPELPRGWFLMPCSTCGHLGFSHDNATDCAECECEQFGVTPLQDEAGVA